MLFLYPIIYIDIRYVIRLKIKKSQEFIIFCCKCNEYIGGLIGGLAIEAIKKGTSANRNPKLASLFHRLEYVDAYGSGIPRILAKYQYQNHKPLIETEENTFFIRFPKIEEKSEKENEQIQLIKEIYSKNKKILREDIEEIYNCSKVTAARKIKSLIEIGILVRVGNGKNIYYEMK